MVRLFWLWIGVLVWLTVGGAWDDYRDRRSLPGIVLSVATGAVCVISVLALLREEIAVTLGRVLLPLAILAGVQLAIDVFGNAREVENDPALSSRENRITKHVAISFVTVVFGAADLVGIGIGLRQWQSAF